MINQLNRVDVLSNNLANANTVGFKEDALVEGSFKSYLNKSTAQNNPDINRLNDIINTIPKIDGEFINGTVGAIVPTNNELDFAIKTPDTFFKVKDNNGNILLTRDGKFQSLNGILTTRNGFTVLSNSNESISTEDENFGQNIAVVKTSLDNLKKSGLNNYNVKDNNNIKQIATNTNDVVQGAVEKSNINTVTTMVALIDAHRRLEQAQKAITSIDEINGKVISKVGSPR